MDEGMLLFKKVKPDIDFIGTIFEYDVRQLEQTDGVLIGKYSIALAQYLIYFKSQINKTKVEIHRKQCILDGAVTQLLTSDILKQYKTKSNAYEYIVSSTKEFDYIRNEINIYKEELMLLDGIDKQISELIASLKRELTRRESELYAIRKERYS